MNTLARAHARTRQVSIEGQTERPEGRFFSFTAVRKLDGQAWPLDLHQKVCPPASHIQIHAHAPYVYVLHIPYLHTPPQVEAAPYPQGGFGFFQHETSC